MMRSYMMFVFLAAVAFFFNPSRASAQLLLDETAQDLKSLQKWQKNCFVDETCVRTPYVEDWWVEADNYCGRPNLHPRFKREFCCRYDLLDGEECAGVPRLRVRKKVEPPPPPASQEDLDRLRQQVEEDRREIEEVKETLDGIPEVPPDLIRRLDDIDGTLGRLATEVAKQGTKLNQLEARGWPLRIQLLPAGGYRFVFDGHRRLDSGYWIGMEVVFLTKDTGFPWEFSVYGGGGGTNRTSSAALGVVGGTVKYRILDQLLRVQVYGEYWAGSDDANHAPLERGALGGVGAAYMPLQHLPSDKHRWLRDAVVIEVKLGVGIRLPAAGAWREHLSFLGTVEGFVKFNMLDF